MSIKFIGKSILNNGELLFNVPFIIREMVICDNIIIVLEDYGIQGIDTIKNSENIYGFDLKGNKLWQIEPMDYGRKSSPYTGLYKNGEKIMGYNRNGVEVEINPPSGKIISKELIK